MLIATTQGENMLRRIACLTFLVVIGTAFAASQDDKSKRPSPPAQAQCKFPDGKTTTEHYSSPRAQGRKICGGLVPYDEACRTGANDATTLATNANLTAASKD